MDATLKAKWLEALRSGKYAQTSGQLRLGNCFCCLGVLCDIFNPKGWDTPKNSSYSYEWFYGEGPDESREVGVLPHAFRISSGISSDLQDRLISLNDDGAPFSEIAAYIEANL
jgi:hypothetical protein